MNQAQHTPMMQGSLYGLKPYSLFVSVSQCLSHAGNAHGFESPGLSVVGTNSRIAPTNS